MEIPHLTPVTNSTKSNDKIFAAAQASQKYSDEKRRLEVVIATSKYAGGPDTAKQTAENQSTVKLEEKNLSNYAAQLNILIHTVPQTVAIQKQISDLNSKVTKSKAKIESAKTQLKNLNAAQKANQKAGEKAAADLKKLLKTGVVSTSSSGNGGGGKGDGKSDGGFKYNAPMVKSAYIRGIQAYITADPNLITSPGKYESARNAWGDGKPAKGAIQMSTRFSDVITSAQNGKSGSKPSSVDTTKYGFKFLYNPQSINMAWGIVESFSPQFEASGQDKASAISVGLMKSAITFTLMLNRIGDMQFINSNGILSNTVTQTNGVNYITQNIPQFLSTDIYPSNVDNNELKLIYERGTMYDLEYLFRTTGGYNATYDATVLGGPTADKGWLMPIPVELHLGNGLRYLVRVSQLDLQHIIFDSRMVPVLSQVNVTCTRYYDGPEMYQTGETGATALGKLDVFGNNIDLTKTGLQGGVK